MSAFKRQKEKGTAAVEFAFCILILMLLLWGLVSFGFIWLQNHYIANASREGARVAAMDFPSTADRDAAVNEAIATYLDGLYPFEDLQPPLLTIDGPTEETIDALVHYRVSVTVDISEMGIPSLFNSFSELITGDEYTLPEEITQTAVFPKNSQPPP